MDKDCRVCLQLSQAARTFRDHVDEPFVIISLGAPSMPAVVLRKHQCGSLGQEVLVVALSALKDVACKVYGNHYYIDTWSKNRIGLGFEQYHWFAQARPLHCVESFEKN